MYTPTPFQETRPEVLRELMRRHPLAAVVTTTPDGLTANHVPLVFDPSSGVNGVLRGHVARANPVWRVVAGGSPVLAIFQGPDHYVSPSWYPAKAAHGKVVPTWNYAIVQARGHARIIDDRDWLAEQINELTGTHEAGRTDPWHVSDAPEPFIEAQIKGIIGIEIDIVSLVGKWKVSQNRPGADREGVVRGLIDERTDAASIEMAEIVREYSERANR
jgi:transcriptional regulator